MPAPRALSILLCLCLLLTLAAPVAAGDNPFQPAPPFKSAIIKYAFSGSQSGSATTYYKGDTKAEHKDLVTKVMGMSNQERQIVITQPQRITTVDLANGKATYTGNYLTYLAQEYEKLSPAEKKQVKKNAEAMGKNFASMLGGKPKITKGTYEGKPVDIVTVMGITSYTWRGKQVVLKQEGSVMGMQMNMRATSIQQGVKVPASKLAPPPGVKPVFDREADQRQRQMAKQIMAMLKDPNAASNQNRAMQDAQRRMAEERAKHPQSQQQDQDSQPDAVKEGLDAVKKLFKW